MAVSRNDGGSYRKRKPGGVFRGSSSFSKWAFRIVAIIFVTLCLFGVINQAALGQSLWKWLVDTGTAFGHTLSYLFVGEDPGLPIDVTNEGIYIDGYAPEGAGNISVESLG